MERVKFKSVVLSVMQIQSIATQFFTPPHIYNY